MVAEPVCPYIVYLHGAWTRLPDPYLVLEHVQGCTLRARLLAPHHYEREQEKRPVAAPSPPARPAADPSARLDAADACGDSSGPLPLELRLRWAAQLAVALHSVHT